MGARPPRGCFVARGCQQKKQGTLGLLPSTPALGMLDGIIRRREEGWGGLSARRAARWYQMHQNPCFPKKNSDALRCMSCQSLFSPGAIAAPSTTRGFAGGRRAPPSRSHRSGDLLQPQICKSCSAEGGVQRRTPPPWPRKCTLTGEAWRKTARIGRRGGAVWLDPASTGLCGRGGEPPSPSEDTRAMHQDKHACRQKNQHTGRQRHDRVCTRMYVCVRVRAGPQATAQLHSDVPGEAAPACACTRVLAAHACVGANATWGDALPPPALPSHARSWASVHARLPRSVRPHAGARPLGEDGQCRGWGASGSPGSLRPDAFITPGCKPHSRPHSWRSHPSGAAASCHPPAIAPTPPGSRTFGDGIQCGRQRAESVRRVRCECAKKAGSVQGANSGCGV